MRPTRVASGSDARRAASTPSAEGCRLPDRPSVLSRERSGRRSTLGRAPAPELGRLERVATSEACIEAILAERERRVLSLPAAAPSSSRSDPLLELDELRREA